MISFSKKALPILGLGLIFHVPSQKLHAHSITCNDSLKVKETAICDSLIALFNEKRELKEFKEGERILLEVLDYCPENSQYWSKLALNYFEEADNTYAKNKPLNKTTKISLFEKGLHAAKISATKDSLNTLAYENISMGFAGKLSLSSYRQQAILADSVRIYAEKSIQVDPNNDRSYHILGRWHYEVANLNWLIKLFSELFIGVVPQGSYEKALTYFQKAAEISDAPLHHYWLGLDYLKMGKTKEAEESFKKALHAKGGNYNNEYVRELSLKILNEKYD